MKRLILFFLIFFVLIPSSSSIYVTRTISYNGTTYDSPALISGTNHFIDITLTAYPISDFDYPGFYIQEYIPYDMSVVSSTADFSEYKDHTLTIISLLPSSSSVSYRLKLPYTDIKDASIVGVFRDENKTKYDIPESKISYRFESSPDSESSSSLLKPTATSTSPQVTDFPISIKASSPIELTANQTNDESIYRNIYHSTYFYLFLLIITLPVLLYFKTKPKSYTILKEIPFTIKNSKLTLDNVLYPADFTISISNPSKKAYLAHIQDLTKTFHVENNDTCLLSQSTVSFSLKLLKTEDASGILTICGR